MRLLSLVLVCAGLALGARAAEAQTYKYDDKGRLIQVGNANGLTTTYVYDNADNRTSAVTVANHAPTCSNGSYQFPIPTNVPPQAVSVSTTSIFTGNCTDADGDTLTVTNPALPLNFTIAAGQAIPYSFTVSDGKGGTATATETFTRP